MAEDAIFERIRGEWQGTVEMVSAKCVDQAQTTRLCCSDAPLLVNATILFERESNGDRKLKYAYDTVLNVPQSTGYLVFQPTFSWTTIIRNLTAARNDAFIIMSAYTMDTSYCMHVQEGSSADSMVMAIRVRSIYLPGVWGTDYWCSSFVAASTSSGCTAGTVWPNINGNNTWPETSFWHDSIVTLSRKPTNSSSTTGAPAIQNTGPVAGEESNTVLIVAIAVTAAVVLSIAAIAFVFFRRRLRGRPGAASTKDSVAESVNNEGGSRTPTPVTKTKTPETAIEVTNTENVGKSFTADGSTKETTEWGCDVQIVVQGMREHWLINRDDVVIDEDPVEKGGFGDVRTGMLYNSTKIAVKTCLSSQKDDNSRRNTWLALANEMRLLRRTRHPNIVLFFGIVVLPGGRIGLILEWVEGMNLKGYTNKCGQRLSLMPEEASGEAPNHKRKLLLDVATGMHFLHAQKPPIIHRDLKPANVLVEMVATPPRAKITDFGVSVLLEGDDVQGRSGTKSYMAPEVVAGKQYNVSADVYSYGCTFAYTFIGKLPDRAKLKKGIADAVSVIGASRKTINTITGTLAEEPGDRPDFSTVRLALQQWVDSDDQQPPGEISSGGGSARSFSHQTQQRTTMSI